MVYFQTKIPILGKFWKVLKWKLLVYFIALWFVLQPFGIYYCCLVYFIVVWYIFGSFGIFSLFWCIVKTKNLATLFLIRLSLPKFSSLDSSSADELESDDDDRHDEVHLRVLENLLGNARKGEWWAS
jgi:hypothetical protein